MKATLLLIFVIIIQLHLFGQNDIWSYLEKNCPDSIPEVFLPGIVSGKHHEHSSPTFCPDGKTIYWTTVHNSLQRHTIMQTQFENGTFSIPNIAPFSGKFRDFQIVSTNEKNKFILCTVRPIQSESTSKPTLGIWEMSKQKEGWSALTHISFANDTNNEAISLSITRTNILYFERGKFFYYSRYKNGRYLQPQLINDDIYSDKQDWMPFVSFGEDFMIIVSDRDGGYGSFDLYISFKDETGHWTKPMNMGNKVNTKEQERCPGVTPDGKYLFFTRPNPPNKDDIWWVNAKIIEELRLKTINGN